MTQKKRDGIPQERRDSGPPPKGGDQKPEVGKSFKPPQPQPEPKKKN
jgi:hypothetical protein